MTQNIQWYSLSISRLNLAGVFLQQLGAMGSGSSPNANDWTPNSHNSNFFPFPEVVASYCDCPVNMPTSLGMFEGPFAIIILMIQCGPINKVFFGLKTLLDYLHKPRAQVPPRMFHHSGVSKPELPIGFSKQKMTPSLSWKDHSWHNFNQIWCFHLFIIMFLGCYNPCWSQLLISRPLIFSPLATALPQISKHPPVTQSDLRKSFFLNQESPQWLLPQYHPATRSDLERQESIISPVSQVAGTGKGSDLFEVVPQGWGTGRKRSREFWLPVPLQSVSGNQPSAHKLLQVQERPRLLQQTWLPASWRKRAHMGSS